MRENVGARRRLLTAYLFVALLAVAVDCASATARVSAHGAAPAVVEACASARLPREILDGATGLGRLPLRVVDATAPQATLRLAVAADEPSREAGLMCVLRLRPQDGMVFVFSHESTWEFWMKNTLIPLDMVWVRANGTVSTIAANVPSSTRTTPERALARRRGRGLYVVELRAGEAATDGLAVGAHLELPTLRTDR